MSHKREFRKELSMIGIWNTFHKKEFRKESNIRQLRDKLYTNLNKKSNKSNTYNHLYNTSNNHLYNTSNNHMFNTSNHQQLLRLLYNHLLYLFNTSLSHQFNTSVNHQFNTSLKDINHGPLNNHGSLNNHGPLNNNGSMLLYNESRPKNQILKIKDYQKNYLIEKFIFIYRLKILLFYFFIKKINKLKFFIII